MSIKFEFKENDWFRNEVLEKKFWYRRDSKGFAGLVSEPVKINWKSKEKDLTGGLLDLVCSAYEEEQQSKTTNGKEQAAKKGDKRLTPLQKQLKSKISKTATGGFSFFAWFGYIGHRVTAEESAAATAKQQAEREAQKAGKKIDPPSENDVEGDEDDEEEDLSYELEIFPDGDDLAVAISEDLWPGALKYFSTFVLVFSHHRHRSLFHDTLHSLAFAHVMLRPHVISTLRNHFNKNVQANNHVTNQPKHKKQTPCPT